MRIRLRFILCALFLAASPALAQTAGMVSFQGLIRDSGGTAITSPISLQFRIYTADTAGSLVDMDGDGTVEPAPMPSGGGTDVILVGPLTPNGGIVSTKFGPVSPKAFAGCTPGVAGCRWLEVTVLNSPNPPSVLSRLEMVTPPGAAEQLNALQSGNDALVTNAAGNVGIGIPNPSSKLHLSSGADHVPAVLTLQDSGGRTCVVRSPGIGDAQVGTSTGHSLQLITNNTPKVFIHETNGNVGIGDLDPEEKLHLGPGTSGTTLQIGDYTAIGERVSSGATIVGDNVKPADASDTMVFMQTTANAGGRAIDLDFTKGITFHASAGSTTAGATFSNEIMRIANNGNVGIGTPNPNVKLHVTGSIVATGTCNCSSDARLKKNIATVGTALGKLLSLRGVWFQWKDPKEHGDEARRQMGMIAQEVEKVLPEWVITDKKGYRYLNTNGFPALAVEAMREMKNENDALKAHVSKLEERLARLETALADKPESIRNTPERK